MQCSRLRELTREDAEDLRMLRMNVTTMASKDDGQDVEQDDK